MQATDIESARKDLLQWSPPIIADLMVESYSIQLHITHVSRRVLCSMHARLWRLMLQEDREKTNAARRELVDFARLAGLDKPALDAVDQAVLEELLDVVTARFARTPDLIRVYSRLLLRTSANLAEMRIVAC